MQQRLSCPARSRVRSARRPFRFWNAAAFACALGALTLGAADFAAASLPKITSAGVFTEAAGKQHKWEITPAHALLWDGAPYLPVGATFSPRSLDDDSPAAWQDDRKAIDALKAAGLRDVLIAPARSLAGLSPAAIQRLLDYLDANGFRYGIAFGPGLESPLSGTVVKPGSYRHENEGQFNAQWRVTQSDSALLVLTERTSGSSNVLQQQSIPIRENTASVAISSPAVGRVVAGLYPHKTLPASGEGALPDIWAGVDAYRDSLLATLAKVKWGPGLRFWLDPLARHIGLTGETENLVPDSNAFRLEWESFLSRHYTNADECVKSWGLTESKIATFRDLAAFIPLWANGRGVPYLYDLRARKIQRILDAGQSRWWQDFTECRNSSIQDAMNGLADVLKRRVANVPVVVTWTQTHPIFWNRSRAAGFDGLSIAPHASDSALLPRTLGPAYSEAEQAERTLWCPVTEIAPNAAPTGARLVTAALPASPGDNAASATDLYANRLALLNDLDRMRQAGMKGFFLGATPAPDLLSGRDKSQPLHPTPYTLFPDLLAWLHDAATPLVDSPASANYAPAVLFFPMDAPGPARVGLVPGRTDALWLSAYATGATLDWWPSYTGYAMLDAAGSQTTVLVSSQGKRKTRLLVADPRRIRATLPEGTTVPFKIVSPREIEIMLDTTPTVFNADGQPLIPEEAARDIHDQLAAMYQLALSERNAERDNARSVLDKLTVDMDHRAFEAAYIEGRNELDTVIASLRPYIWLEGEATTDHTFTEIAGNQEASASGYLRLTSQTPPPREGYASKYTFQVPHDGRYSIWIACTVPGPLTSPMKWGLNAPADQTAADPLPQGPLYLNDRIGWIRLGDVTMKANENQKLTVEAVAPAPATGDYSFSIDAVFVTAYPFKPNGPVRPAPVDMSDVMNARTKKKKPETTTQIINKDTRAAEDR